MKKKKKLFGLLLTATLVFTLCGTAFAAETEEQAEETETEDVTVPYKGMMFLLPGNWFYQGDDDTMSFISPDKEAMILLQSVDLSDSDDEYNDDALEILFEVALASIQAQYSEFEEESTTDLTIAGCTAKEMTGTVVSDDTQMSDDALVIYDEESQYFYFIQFVVKNEVEENTAAYENFLDSISLIPHDGDLTIMDERGREYVNEFDPDTNQVLDLYEIEFQIPRDWVEYSSSSEGVTYNSDSYGGTLSVVAVLSEHEDITLEEIQDEVVAIADMGDSFIETGRELVTILDDVPALYFTCTQSISGTPADTYAFAFFTENDFYMFLYVDSQYSAYNHSQEFDEIINSISLATETDTVTYYEVSFWVPETWAALSTDEEEVMYVTENGAMVVNSEEGSFGTDFMGIEENQDFFISEFEDEDSYELIDRQTITVLDDIPALYFKFSFLMDGEPMNYVSTIFSTDERLYLFAHQEFITIGDSHMDYFDEIIDSISWAKDAEAEPLEEETTLGEENALKKALSYLSHSAYSYNGLIEQLEHGGFTSEEATYAADHCGADWYEEALEKALSYLSHSSYSYTGLIKQLEHAGFTEDEATYGADNCDADWYEQAAGKAESYMSHSAYSKDSLIKQLEHAGFTTEQAEYGAAAVGY